MGRLGLWLVGGAVFFFGSNGIAALAGATGAAHGCSVGSCRAKQITFGPVSERSPVISPDGKWLAFEFFHSKWTAYSEIWIMPTDGTFKSARPLVDNRNSNSGPTWSPDGQWISFIEHTSDTPRGHLGIVTDQVCKVSVKSGQVVQLTHLHPHAVTGDSAIWLRDGRIAFKYSGGIYAVPSDGGVAVKLFDVEPRLPKDYEFASLAFSPNAEDVAFEQIDQDGNYHLVIVDLARGSLTHPFPTVVWTGLPAWINDDWLLYSRVDMTRRHYEIWALCVSTGRTERLTDGPFDWNPFFSTALRSIFVSRNGTNDLLYGFHIWRVPVPKSTIERWFRGN